MLERSRKVCDATTLGRSQQEIYRILGGLHACMKWHKGTHNIATDRMVEPSYPAHGTEHEAMPSRRRTLSRACQLARFSRKILRREELCAIHENHGGVCFRLSEGAENTLEVFGTFA